MKTIICTLLFAYLPVCLSAQPLISTSEFYNIGDVIQMTNCNVAAISAGASGADATWDFSKVSTTGSFSVTTVVKDTSSAYPTSNILITLPDGSQEHEKESNTDSYINGISDPGTGITTDYFDYDQSKRPVTFNTNYVDTYFVIISASSTVGRGILNETGDAYGTLITPVGTYNNVLRVVKSQTETDTTGGVAFVIKTTSYLWFDSSHSAPLFRIDSVNSLSGVSISAMYLSGPLAIKNVAGGEAAYRGCLNDNTLLLFGDFDNSNRYNVTVYNITGMKIFNIEFTGHGNSQGFDIGTGIDPGMYMVSITQEGDYPRQKVIKVVKE